MVEEPTSGEMMSRGIKDLDGSWTAITAEAERQFGDRGRMYAILYRPWTARGSIDICEDGLEKAGLRIDRVLQMTQQKRTLAGLRTAMDLLCAWLRADLCPNFLKAGACEKQTCVFKHEFPE